MGYHRFQIGCVFVEYDLFNTTTFIQNCIYMNFRIKFTQFYINFLRRNFTYRWLICIVQCLRFSGFILYPLSYFLYSPFNALKKSYDTLCITVSKYMVALNNVHHHFKLLYFVFLTFMVKRFKFRLQFPFWKLCFYQTIILNIINILFW